MSAGERRERPETGLSPLFGTVKRLIDGATMAFNVVGTVLIFAVMILVNADVVGRGMFDAPISGVPELVSFSIVAIVFLQIAQAMRMGRLTRTEALIGLIGPRWPRISALMGVVFNGASAALIWFLFQASFPLFIKAWERNTFVGSVGDFIAPVWPIKLIILVGCAALLLQFLLAAFRDARVAITGKAEHDAAS